MSEGESHSRVSITMASGWSAEETKALLGAGVLLMSKASWPETEDTHQQDQVHVVFLHSLLLKNDFFSSTCSSYK